MWADALSSEGEQEDIPEENIITSLPELEQAPSAAKKRVPKKKKKVDEDTYVPPPNLVTKLSNKTDSKPMAEPTLSKKERKKKEMEELDDILNEFGLTPQEEEEKNDQKQEEKNRLEGKGSKVSKKEIFQSVRAEINARQEKSKKNKKKDHFKRP